MDGRTWLGTRGSGTETGCDTRRNRISRTSRNACDISTLAFCTITRSLIRQPQRRATETAIADKPAPDIFAIAICRPRPEGWYDQI